MRMTKAMEVVGGTDNNQLKASAERKGSDGDTRLHILIICIIIMIAVKCKNLTFFALS